MVKEILFDPVPKICPDKFCPECKGFGYCTTPEGETQECICVFKSRAIHYLTPEYATSPYTKIIEIEPFLGKNLIIQGTPSYFKHLVKSFLLGTLMKFQHKTKTAFDIIKPYINSAQTSEWEDLTTIPLLFLCLSYDPPNKVYGNVLQSLLQKRMFKGLPTWIFSDKLIESETFAKIYSIEFVDYLKSGLKSELFVLKKQ